MGGFVSIVGAGPGDPELLTLAGRDRLSRADVVIADYLVNPAVLAHCRPGVEVIQRRRGPRTGAKILQRHINEMLVERARAGDHVVRLKGGDPFLFGRGAEEAQVLRKHGIPYELVPGVSSPIAAPEAAGIPVTHRDHTPAVTFVSGFEAYEKAGMEVAWTHLARSAGTLVLMMSVKNARDNAARLVGAGRSAETPTAVVRWGTRGIQRCVVATLGTIADRIEAENIRPPAVMVIGDVVNLREQLAWREQLPLFGRRVVVTRSRTQAAPLAHALAMQGADVVLVPCIEVLPPEDPDAFDAALSRLGEHDGVIVSSPNGAEALFTGLERSALDVRALAGMLVATVGAGTARSCRSRGLVPDIVAEDSRSEGLVDRLRNAGALGKHWLHVRGRDGRRVLGDAIDGAGGRYELAVAYRTARPEVSPHVLRTLRATGDDGEGMDAVCLASGKAARHFVQTLTEAHGEAEASRSLSQAKVITIGPITTSSVESLGIRVDQTAAEASNDGVLRAVIEVFADHG